MMIRCPKCARSYWSASRSADCPHPLRAMSDEEIEAGLEEGEWYRRRIQFMVERGDAERRGAFWNIIFWVAALLALLALISH